MPVTRTPNPEPRALLVIRPTALGDVARTVPCLATLRRAYPQARIDWLVHAGYRDAVAAHPMLDGVIPFERKTLGGLPWRVAAWAELAALTGRLRRAEAPSAFAGPHGSARYDAVYDLQGLARSALFTRVTGARERHGFADAREHAPLGYNRRHRVAAGPHTVDRMLGLLEAAGHEPVADMRLYVPDDAAAWAADWLAEQGIEPGGYLCLAPTAQWPAKCWPVDRYAELARGLIDSGAVADRAVILAAPHEAAAVQPLLDALGRRAVHPDTSVGRLMAVLARARLLIANDSAPLHLAVGLGTPFVAIYGPTDPAEVGPYLHREWVVRPQGVTAEQVVWHRSHRDDTELIASLPLAPVRAMAERVLGETGRSRHAGV